MFISYKDPKASYQEWKLVQIDFEKSIQDNPNVISNCKFTFNFLIRHPDDAEYSPPNQGFWTEYHPSNQQLSIHEHFHLIKAMPNLNEYCKSKSLSAFTQTLYLHHTNIFIHGPFNFATINGRQSQDQIDIQDWMELKSKALLYDNPPPTLDSVNHTFSYHIDSQYHAIHSNLEVTRQLYQQSFVLHFSAD